MSTLIAAIIVVVAGLGLATGGVYVLVENTKPDSNIQFENAPAPNNTGGVVNYGTK
ncbi:hypothetical protein KIPE111705_10830 [Kibdelosporangium persicum]|uniref:DUF2613 domain-containing protein n=1 Tax=Kibdelosporangium persicum TaxID=2698649 RepID=A0ABX2EZ80_9PSEU|nr:hypothetical protein [Kibdelosporangium persicum]NRN64199.1 hypothetical protein [Kibdelosporangium persicum]